MPSCNSKMIKDWKAFREQALKLAEQGIILIYGDFCTELQEIAFDSLQIAKSKGVKTATVLINSTGGMNIVYTAIKGAMALSGMKFTGIVVGMASSNGFNILQTCHKRLAIPGSYLMFHWGHSGFNNQELAAILAGELWPIDNMKRAEIQSAEFVSKRTNVSMEQLTQYALYERYFMADEAITIGFLDEVLPELPSKFKLPSLE